MADLDSRRPMIEISHIPHRVLLRLKSWLPLQAAPAAPVVLSGLVLPTTAGDIVGNAWRVHCLGPGEWLMMAAPASMTGAGLRAVEHELSLQGVAVVDASHGLAGFALVGPAAREVLSKGCAVDFHPVKFPAGRCVRTRLAQVPVVVVHLDHTTRYELYVARSYAAYLLGWLGDAALEWAVPAP